MYNKRALSRVKLILTKINFIENIVNNKSSIIKALEDEQNSRAAILMHLTSMAEQFDKLIQNGEIEILSYFKKEDIKGSYELRNFIAHDYEGVDLFIVENVIEQRLPIIKQSVLNILESE